MNASIKNRDTKYLVGLFEQFAEQSRYAEGKRATTIFGYRSTFMLLQKLIPNICLEMLTPQMMIEFSRRLQNRERVVGRGLIKSGVKNSTLATYRSKLESFFDWLLAHGYLKESPFKGIARPLVSYTDRKYLERESVERIFTTAGFLIDWKNQLVKKRNLAILAVLLHCGLRKGEMLGLKLTDINLSSAELTVRAETSKSRRDRIVPMNSAVTLMIEEYLVERRLREYTTAFLFVSENRDDGLTYHGYKHLVEVLQKRCNVKFHTHQFRHTHAVNLLANGTDVVTIQQLLGHTDPRMTSVYLRNLPTQVKRSRVELLSNTGNLV